MPQSTSGSTTGRMPVLFVGHGSPMNAIEDNVWSSGIRALTAQIPRPKAILSVSAHWHVPGTFLTGNEHPETLYDFGGFAAPLFAHKYPAPGDVQLAKRAARLLGERASLRNDHGLDYATWTVLYNMYPEADCPVVQLSMDSRLKPADHLELGRALAPLREEGILVMGSGMVVHNLHHALGIYRQGDPVPAWALRFDADVARAAEQHDGAFLARTLETDLGRISHPTHEHYLPLLYTMGAADERDTVRFPITGFDMSTSMRSILFG